MMPERIYQNAAMDAHFAALNQLKANIGHKPTEVDVAKSLAMAFGDALGLVIASGGNAPDTEPCLDLVTARCDAMVSAILTDGCVGSA
jgi:hypothetical protein